MAPTLDVRHLMVPASVLTWIVLSLGIFFVTYLARRSRLKRNGNGIPQVGPTGIAALTATNISWKELVVNAYSKFSKQGKPFKFLGTTVIPPSTFLDYRRAGAKVLSTEEIVNKSLFFDLWLGNDHFDCVNFIKLNVVRNIPNMINPINDEVQIMFDGEWSGSNARNSVTRNADGKEVHHIHVYPAQLRGVGRISARMLVGQKYAETPPWVDTASAYAEGVFRNVAIFKLCPDFLKPVLSGWVPTGTQIKTLKSIIRDDVQRWVKEDVRGDEGAADDPNKEITFMRLMVKYVQALPSYQHATVEQILHGSVGRTISAMFATIDTTTLTTTHAIYDLRSHAYEQYGGPIKRQIDEVFANNDRQWTQRALTQLPLLDSFIKESQRLHALSATLSSRYVSPAEGYTLKTQSPLDPDLYFAQGTQLATPLWGVHMDADHYPEPFKFDGFRFAKDEAPSSIPSDKFMAFGHGKHQCPGRLLALVVVKSILIEFLNRYEWDAGCERPRDWELLSVNQPDKQAILDFIHRKKS